MQKLKKQCTNTEEELSLEEDNNEVVSTVPGLSGQGRCAKYSKNPKGSQPAKSLTAGFFPPLWNKLFDLTKARMQLYVALEEPVPHHEVAMQGQCSKILFEVLVHYEENSLEVEAGISSPSSLVSLLLICILFKGYYLQYKLDMILADMHTFHSEIKKAAIQIILAHYKLFPPPSAMTDTD
ncbi:hypothetical protein PISMIDRAFT_18824 [Pisolithus microcarpus 441]|uniref:Uncharacterized protein n=1 Tax=Pisolithus microcarpus 441 TaxID=765257 RepID=A0A0C9YEI4_9AGAM|nr:hypothetical protein PISMIDRAFT_18824 [Pisolithus microcarpus 441]